MSKDEDLYSVFEIHEILVIIKEIEKLMFDDFLKVIELKDSEDIPTLSIGQWLQENYTTLDNLDMITMYLERFDAYKHYTMALDNIDIKANNVLVTMLRGVTYDNLSKIMNTLEAIKKAIKENNAWDLDRCEATAKRPESEKE